MKFKTTKKAVMNGYGKVVKVGYCHLQTLLGGECAVAYTGGQYGWNADVYDFGGTAIVTGYAPFGNIAPDFDTVNRFEQAAEAIYRDKAVGYDDRKQAFRALLAEFVKTVTCC